MYIPQDKVVLRTRRTWVTLLSGFCYGIKKKSSGKYFYEIKHSYLLATVALKVVKIESVGLTMLQRLSL